MKITKLVPWLVKAAGTYWGEYFFVEVRTDEGVTGWGEITTTTTDGQPRRRRHHAAAQRASRRRRPGAASSRSGTRRSAAFTYMGSARRHEPRASAASTSRCGTSAARCSGCRSTTCSAGKVRDDILLYTPSRTVASSTPTKARVQEIRAIVDSGHTALKFDPFPHVERTGAADDDYLDGGIGTRGGGDRR